MDKTNLLILKMITHSNLEDTVVNSIETAGQTLMRIIKSIGGVFGTLLVAICSLVIIYILIKAAWEQMREGQNSLAEHGKTIAVVVVLAVVGGLIVSASF